MSGKERSAKGCVSPLQCKKKFQRGLCEEKVNHSQDCCRCMVPLCGQLVCSRAFPGALARLPNVFFPPGKLRDRPVYRTRRDHAREEGPCRDIFWKFALALAMLFKLDDTERRRMSVCWVSINVATSFFVCNPRGSPPPGPHSKRGIFFNSFEQGEDYNGQKHDLVKSFTEGTSGRDKKRSKLEEWTRMTTNRRRGPEKAVIWESQIRNQSQEELSL